MTPKRDEDKFKLLHFKFIYQLKSIKERNNIEFFYKSGILPFRLLDDNRIKK